MERYAHVTAAQQRQIAELLEQALTGPDLTVTVRVTEPPDGVVEGAPEQPENRAIRSGGWLRR